jgi:hypothetical protein
MGNLMRIILARELKPIKNGWAAYAQGLGIAAHGATPELADRNLEHTARLFFQPARRAGTLLDQLATLGIQITDGEDEDLTVEVGS